MYKWNVGDVITADKLNALFGGDGSDGDLSISSGTVTLDLGGAKVFIKNYKSISITGTGKLAFTNPNDNGTIVILKSQGNVVLTSSTVPLIDLRGIGAKGGVITTGSGTDGYNSNAGTGGKGGVYSYNTSTGGGGGGAGAGANGGTGGYTGTAPSGGTKNSLTIINKVLPYLLVGAGGGAGSASYPSGNYWPGSNGGRGGGALYIECAGDLNFTGTIDVSGQQGVDLASSSGAGGGGGAGSCTIIYNTATSIAGTINATGGRGGNITGNYGGYSGGGGGGYSGAGSNGTSGTNAAGGAGGAGSGGFVAKVTEFLENGSLFINYARY